MLSIGLLSSGAPGMTGAPAPDALTARQTAPSPAVPPAGAPLPASRQANTVVILTIRGPIDRWTSYSVQRRLKQAEQAGADAVVIDLDTPGGEVGAVLEITAALKGLSIPNTVAWINKTAYSGGAIIALACREIIVNDPATMGDAAPIMVSPITGLQTLGVTEREKLLRPLLTDLIDSAQRNGYDELLVQAFVATGVELWMVEHIATGARLFVDEREYSLLFPGEPPRGRIDFSALDAPTAPDGRDARPTSAGERMNEIRLVSPQLSDKLRTGIQEDLDVTGSHSRRPVITSVSRGEYRFIGYASDGSLLTLTTKNLVRYGFATTVVHHDQELSQYFGAQTMNRLSASWSEMLARFLSNFWIKGFLVVVFLLALFMEMAAPGIGLAGGVALGALALLVAPQFLVGAAAWWGLASIGGGLLLIAIELFLIPGFGIPGVAGVVLLFAGLLGVIVGPGGLGAESRDDLVYGAATLLLALFTAGVCMYFLSKHFRTVPLLNRLVLTDTGRRDERSADLLAAMRPEEGGRVEVGAAGVALTPLRPAGTAEFGDRLLDVVSDYGFIDAGSPVRVTSVGRFRVTVEPDDGERERTAARTVPPGDRTVQRTVPPPSESSG